MTKECCQQTCPTPHYSKGGRPKGASVITDILSLAARPEVISFAGGLPSPKRFPIEAVKAAACKVLDEKGAVALQYSAAPGVKELREAIAEQETKRGVPTTVDEVLITSGSQQGLDMIARLFLDEGSKMLVESPTYMGALGAFNFCFPEYVEMKTDDEGLNPDWLGEECRGARFAYVMPTFQNPSGRTISEERRRRLCEKAREYDFWLLEDDPYGEIYFGERPPVSLRAIAPERTIRMSSMSKVLAPGFRLGYIVAPKHVIDALIEMKQSVDLHTSTFTQLITAEVLKGGLMENHMPGTRALYAEQAKAMLDALEEFMPKHPELTWTKPTGGMFIWVTFPKEIDAAELMKKVLASDVPVGYVPGFAFYATEARHNEARLSFVTVPVDKIRAGVESIAKALKAELGL